MIPKIINWAWLSSDALPRDYVNNLYSWNQTGYNIKKWDLSSFPTNLLKNIKPENKLLYVKYWSLYHFGGFFIEPDVYITKDYLNNYLDSDYIKVSLKILGAEKNNPEIKKILDNLENNEEIPEEKYIPEASVIIPAYNSSKYISETLESVLSNDYPNFEIIIVNDGSTDNTESMIKNFKDPRIKYYSRKHAGISLTTNFGIKKSSGDYIILMDHDDIMYQDRISHQVEYMEQHPEIDILSSGFRWGTSGDSYFRSGPREITNINESCQLGNPASILRKSSIQKLPYMYEKYYDSCQDYKFWNTAYSHGLSLWVEPTPVVDYRMHPEQETNKNNELQTILSKRISRAYTSQKLTSELTCIIPFMNEGEEVEKTVSSIRGTTEGVQIILINDCSTDGYDYKKISSIFGCTYIENKTNLGVAGSRNYGVSICKTKYFVLLDAHMRFYDDSWDNMIIEELKKHPGSIITSRTTTITKIDGEESDPEQSFTTGAIINMKTPGDEFTAKWTSNYIDKKNKTISRVPCVLGAFYATSVEWWNYIGGLSGLMKYGQDEPLMSLKTWLSGGECFILKNFYVGHIYRNVSPYSIPLNKLTCNSIFLDNIFGEENTETYLENLKKKEGEEKYNNGLELYNENLEEIEKYIKHFKSIKIHSLSWFMKNINLEE